MVAGFAKELKVFGENHKWGSGGNEAKCLKPMRGFGSEVSINFISLSKLTLTLNFLFKDNNKFIRVRVKI